MFILFCALQWEEFMALGRDEPDAPLDEVISSQKPNRCCTLIYTSGTTGQPKGVMLSHDNVSFQLHKHFFKTWSVTCFVPDTDSRDSYREEEESAREADGQKDFSVSWKISTFELEHVKELKSLQCQHFLILLNVSFSNHIYSSRCMCNCNSTCLFWSFPFLLLKDTHITLLLPHSCFRNLFYINFMLACKQTIS